MKIAAAQATPVLLDRDATIARDCDIVDAAAGRGVHLLAPRPVVGAPLPPGETV